MSTAKDRVPAEEPPGWAIERAVAELYDVRDRARIVDRAWQIVSEVVELADEKHDEYDDPDQGGEG